MRSPRNSAKSRYRLLATTSSLRIFVLVLGLVSNIVISRGLGVEGRGDYQVILNLAGIATSLSAIAIDLSIGQTFSDFNRDKDRRDLLSTAAASSAATGIVAAGMSILLVLFLPITDQELNGLLALSIGFLAFMTMLRAMFQRILFLRGEPTRAAMAAVTEALVTLLGCLVLAAMNALSITAVIFLSAAGLLISVLMSLGRAGLSRNVRSHLIGALFSRGVRFYPGQVGLVLFLKVEVFLLAYLGDAESVGVYAVALAVAAPLDVFALAVSSTFLSKIFTGGEDSSAKETLFLVRLNLMVASILGIALGFVAPFAVPLLWGNDFRPTVELVWFLLPGSIAMAIQRPFGQFFSRKGLARVMNLRVFVALAAKIALGIVAISWWGAPGAAISCSLAYMIYAWISLVSFARIRETTIFATVRQMIPTQRVIRTFWHRWRNVKESDA